MDTKDYCLALRIDSGETLYLSQKDWVLGRRNSYIAAKTQSGEIKLLSLPQDIVSTLSKIHARIRYSATTFFIEDMHSINGVFLNGLPLRPLQPVPLATGDRLRLGALYLMVILVPCEE